MISALAQSLLCHLKRSALIPPRSRCLLAVSGGGDSVAMVHLFHEIAPLASLQLHVVHLDHALRPESAQDREFVSKLAQECSLPCSTARRDVAAYALQKGLSLEEAGRCLRYKFFRRVALRHRLDYVLTAHSADDQAETLLMRIISGTSTSGLQGIRARRGHIIRPLLPFSRQELRDYLSEHSFTWREDATNLVPTAPRTQVRLLLMPMLSRWNPRIRESLARLAQSASQDERCLLAQARRLLTATIQPQAPEQYVFPCAKLTLTARAVRLRLYREALNSWHCQTETSHLLAIDNLLYANSGKVVFLPNELQATRNTGSITLGRRPVFQVASTHAPARLPDLALWYSQQTTMGSSTSFIMGEWNLQGTATLEPVSRRPEPYTIWLNPESLTSPLSVRSRQPGDRFFPAGGQGSTKLKKYLNGEKVLPTQRDDQPLLVCGDEIVWVIGMRADQRFLAKIGQENVLSLHIYPLS